MNMKITILTYISALFCIFQIKQAAAACGACGIGGVRPQFRGGMGAGCSCGNAGCTGCNRAIGGRF